MQRLLPAVLFSIVPVIESVIVTLVD